MDECMCTHYHFFPVPLQQMCIMNQSFDSGLSSLLTYKKILSMILLSIQDLPLFSIISLLKAKAQLTHDMKKFFLKVGLYLVL